MGFDQLPLCEFSAPSGVYRGCHPFRHKHIFHIFVIMGHPARTICWNTSKWNSLFFLSCTYSFCEIIFSIALLDRGCDIKQYGNCITCLHGWCFTDKNPRWGCHGLSIGSSLGNLQGCEKIQFLTIFVAHRIVIISGDIILSLQLQNTC